MTVFHVIDLRTKVIEPAKTVEALTPEDAAWIALGIRAARKGPPKSLVCHVYWEDRHHTEMARLYAPAPKVD